MAASYLFSDSIYCCSALSTILIKYQHQETGKTSLTHKKLSWVWHKTRFSIEAAYLELPEVWQYSFIGITVGYSWFHSEPDY